MYKAILNLNGKKIEGTLTFYILKKIQDEILINFERKLTISEIFEKLAEDDMQILSAFLIYSTNKDLNFDFNNLDLEEVYRYIKRLLEICMPLKEISNDDDFEDIPNFSVESDWEFEWMEFMWNTNLKRSDEFLNITPKRFFEQMEVYKKVNNIKNEDTIEEL